MSEFISIRVGQYEQPVNIEVLSQEDGLDWTASTDNEMLNDYINADTIIHDEIARKIIDVLEDMNFDWPE